MSFICNCASPDCAVNGCAIQRRYLDGAASVPWLPLVPVNPPSQTIPQGTPFDGCRPVEPLTEARIRQIIREELAALRREAK